MEYTCPRIREREDTFHNKPFYGTWRDRLAEDQFTYPHYLHHPAHGIYYRYDHQRQPYQLYQPHSSHPQQLPPQPSVQCAMAKMDDCRQTLPDSRRVKSCIAGARDAALSSRDGSTNAPSLFEYEQAYSSVMFHCQAWNGLPA